MISCSHSLLCACLPSADRATLFSPPCPPPIPSLQPPPLLLPLPLQLPQEVQCPAARPLALFCEDGG